MKNQRFVGAIVASFAIIIFFQNCSSQQFDTLSSSDISGAIDVASSSSGQSLVGGSTNGSQNSGPINSDTGSAIGGVNNSGETSTGTSSPSGSGGTGEQAVASPTVGGCKAHYDHMGWTGSADQVLDVELSPFDSYDNSGATEIYAHGGFGVWFTGKARAGATYKESYTKTLDAATSGLVVRFVDINTGKSVQATAADYGTSTVSATNNKKLANFNSLPKQTSSGISLKREFFDKYRTQLGYVTVEFICEGKVVAKGLQDFQSLAFQLSKKMIRTSTGGYVQAPEFNDSGYVKLSCPSEAVAGSTVSCGVVGSFAVSGFYEFNFVRDGRFDNMETIQYPNAPAGVHYVQAKIQYKNGVSDRSQVRTIRVK